MKDSQVSPDSVRPDPNNSNWTIPKTYGVWSLPANSDGTKFRFGNYPIRGKELVREYKKATLVALYTSRDQAKRYADDLNN